MGLLDILAKLGILRYGAKKATWSSGKDMPAEFLMDDVYNAERDLAVRGKPEAAEPPPAGAATPAAGQRFCTQCGTALAADQAYCSGCGAKAAL